MRSETDWVLPFKDERLTEWPNEREDSFVLLLLFCVLFCEKLMDESLMVLVRESFIEEVNEPEDSESELARSENRIDYK